MKALTYSVHAILFIACLAVLSNGKTAYSDDDGPASDVKLERLTWKQFQARLAANKQIKYTMVDAWSTTCGPCMENFPHVLEMHRKYGSKGLAVVSLSLDDPSDKTAVAAAEKFLKQKKAVFTNVLLDENFGEGFEKLNIMAIPAVFVYGPDGKEVKRFTMDDPNNQFTYEEVEKALVRSSRENRELPMKDGIHPKYVESTVICGCGNTFNTRSTKAKIMVEVCSKCHPYFTGSVKFVDAAGRVDKFNKKFQGTYGKGKKVAATSASDKT